MGGEFVPVSMVAWLALNPLGGAIIIGLESLLLSQAFSASAMAPDMLKANNRPCRGISGDVKDARGVVMEATDVTCDRDDKPCR